jgi:hypothetical protein
MTSARPLTFKAHFVPKVIGNDRVLLLSEAGSKYMLRGRLYAQMAPLLDGSRTAEEIVAALSKNVDRQKVDSALNTLVSKGYVEEAAGILPPGQAAFWSGIGINAAAAARRLAQTTAAVTSLPGAGPGSDPRSDPRGKIGALHARTQRIEQLVGTFAAIQARIARAGDHVNARQQLIESSRTRRLRRLRKFLRGEIACTKGQRARHPLFDNRTFGDGTIRGRRSHFRCARRLLGKSFGRHRNGERLRSP